LKPVHKINQSVARISTDWFTNSKKIARVHILFKRKHLALTMTIDATTEHLFLKQHASKSMLIFCENFENVF
jgi:hypothetical protein